MTAKTHRLGLTTSEAARHLGVSLSTIRRWSDLGYLRGYRTPGGQRRFSIEQLDEFIDSLQSGGPLRQAPAPETPDEPTFDPGAAFRDDEPRFQARRAVVEPAHQPEPDES
ncbi:MAG: helix-turn-helix protein [Solirubrobacteraceae bacterium]|nr:helix-turn-helix protein [Solirubrobacteraceae bacterium]